MQKPSLINRATGYTFVGLAAGVFYREFTKLNGFEGRTMLSFLHPHLLMLGTLLMLLLVLFVRQFPLAQEKQFGIFLRLHDIGLPFMVVMMGVRGVLQVLGTDLSRGADAAISGVAGLAHIILGASLVFLMLALKKAVAKAD